MKVSDYRRLLSHLPQDAEVMAFQDELGFFYEAANPRVVKIREEEEEDVRGGTRWTFADFVCESEMLGEEEVVRVA